MMPTYSALDTSGADAAIAKTFVEVWNKRAKAGFENTNDRVAAAMRLMETVRGRAIHRIAEVGVEAFNDEVRALYGDLEVPGITLPGKPMPMDNDELAEVNAAEAELKARIDLGLPIHPADDYGSAPGDVVVAEEPAANDPDDPFAGL